MIRILMIEDNVEYAKAVRLLLSEVTEEEFDLVHVTRVGDGMLQLDHYIFDIILLDLMLPYKSGYSLLKMIREEDSSTVIIVISSLDAKEDILSCTAISIQGYMVKPVNLSQLNMKVLEYYGKTSVTHAKVAESFRQPIQE